MKVYLDNAATTPVAPEIIEMMSEMMKTTFANPSSIHSYGRQSRSLLKVRKRIAKLLNTFLDQFFTSEEQSWIIWQ